MFTRGYTLLFLSPGYVRPGSDEHLEDRRSAVRASHPHLRKRQVRKLDKAVVFDEAAVPKKAGWWFGT